MSKIKIGLSISLTGSYSIQGIESFEGLKLWLSELNHLGGIFVKEYNAKLPVELIYYDDESSIDKCRVNIKRLISDDIVEILLGPYSSSLALAACEIAEQYNRTLWNHGGSTDEIEERNFTSVINAITPASRYSFGIIDAVLNADRGLKKIATFSAENSGFSTRVSNGARFHAEQKGLEVKEFKFQSGIKEFSSLIDDLRSYKPGFLLGMGRAEDDLRLAKALFEAGFYTKAAAFIVASIKLFKENFGQKADGILSASQWEKGMKISPDIGPTPEEFFSNFQAAYDKEPDYVAAQGYNIGVIINKCIRETGTLDDLTLREFAKRAKFNTFYGNFKTDGDGNQIGHEMVVVQWQNSQKVIVYPQSQAQAEIIYPR